LNLAHCSCTRVAKIVAAASF